MDKAEKRKLLERERQEQAQRDRALLEREREIVKKLAPGAEHLSEEEWEAIEARSQKRLEEYIEANPSPNLTDEEIGCGPDEACIVEMPAHLMFYQSMEDAEAKGKLSFKDGYRRTVFLDGIYYTIVSRACYEAETASSGGRK
jgi:hypothetical protein